MAFSTSPTTEALAQTLAVLRGVTPDEAIAQALRAELERQAAHPVAAAVQDVNQEELMSRIRRLGPWQGPASTALIEELYDAEGLPR